VSCEPTFERKIDLINLAANGLAPNWTATVSATSGVSGRRPAAGQITTMCSRPEERHFRSMVGPTPKRLTTSGHGCSSSDLLLVARCTFQTQLF